MPLVLTSTQVLPPTVPGTPSIPPDGQVQVGSMRATWTSPDGDVIDLTAPPDAHGWFTRPEVAGWGAAPVTLVTDPLARGGVTVRHQRTEARRLTWPLHVFGDTHLQFWQRYRQLMGYFTSTKYRGPGTLTVYRSEDGSARSIDCLYEAGWGGEANENVRYANPTLTLLCPDGYWRGVEPQTIRREHNDGDTDYLDPYPSVTSGQVLGESTVFNSGDVETWPSWVITGLATQFAATNVTTGEAFTLTYTLSAGAQATITLTRDRALVRGPGGENIVGHLNWPGASLWSLLPGSNDVDFVASGSAPGTSVELSFVPQYEAA